MSAFSAAKSSCAAEGAKIAIVQTPADLSVIEYCDYALSLIANVFIKCAFIY